MATLTESAKVAKTTIKFGVVLLVVLMVGRVLLTGLLGIYRSLVPPPIAAATVGFGKLPAINFPETSGSELSYVLETVGNEIPSFGPNAKVFFISKSRVSLLGLDRGKKQAASLGFVFEPEQISGTLYRWTKSSPLPSTLELDYTSGVFNLEVRWQTNPNFLSSRLLPNELQAISETRTFLKNAGSLPIDMANGEIKATFLKFSGGQMTETLSLSQADFIRVDMFRQPVDDLSILPTDPKKGVARVLISGSRTQGQRIVSAEYRHTRVEYEQFHTYPLISGTVAWEKLKVGEGLVASNPSENNRVVVRKIKLAYFDSLDDQSYLQPIYVFEGDNDFVGYVPAIDPEWIQQ